MGKFARIIAVFTVFCLMLSSVSLAECGIGDAAFYMPETIVQPDTVYGPDADALSKAAAAAAAEAAANSAGTEGFVTRMYSVVLGREPDATGFTTWVTELESGRLGAADLVTRFFNSVEYQGKHKSSEAIVIDCYNAMLDRNPDPSGLEHWKQMLDVGMTSDKVCAGFLNSNEFLGLANSYGIKRGTIVLKNERDQNYERTAFVYRLYQDCLQRVPDISGLEHWCRMLGLGTEGTSVARGFVFSDEYKGRLPSNEAFVDMLYRTIMGREGDAAGKEHWTDLLNYTATRERVLNGFMFSPEFSGKCAKAGINVGQKIAEPDTTREWQANILVLSLVNEERAKAGVKPLTTREDLWEKVALVRAQEIKTLFSHTRPDHSSWDTAYTQAGFPPSMIGENIAFGYSSEQEVVQAWINSAPHLKNMLTDSFTTLATGLYAKTNWVQNFYTEY